MRDDFKTVQRAIDETQLTREEVVLGWSFHTRSREQVVTPLLTMVDQMMTAELGAYQVDSDVDTGENREIRGTVEAPNFRSSR